jgi:predicted ATP-grasp superfamily ATP-dependent carboligase
MKDGEHLIIVGASVRAAAFSALRAGFQPWCVDLFGDADLRARAPVTVIPRSQYPRGLVDIVRREAPPGPLMYTGGLENYSDVVDQLAELRPLWGNDSHVLRRVRDPLALTVALQQCTPPVSFDAGSIPRDGSWLCKPLRGSGGSGIERWLQNSKARPGRFFQTIVRGLPVAAIYVGDGVRQCRLMGVTRQLVSEPWLHARPFQYCGSIGPLSLDPASMKVLRQIGTRLVEFFGIRGIFGIDCVLHGNQPMVIEVNPRYTASVEVLEHALAVHAMEYHARAIEWPGRPEVCEFRTREPTFTLGKAILFARESLSFPFISGRNCLIESQPSLEDIPPCADIPAPDTVIERGQPMLSYFAQGALPDDCLEQLRNHAALLDRCLFRR